jgi:hypothetical protein
VSDIEALKNLRKPFPPNQISKLPKPTKKQTEELRANYKVGQRCSLCGGWHQADVIHLDYVGHAALTDRLLDTDPAWSWEPLSMSQDGLPVMDSLGGMWIKLTVCGVTRLGYGHAGEKSGGDAIKEVIGDALRNAAMRFGAALELWHKGDLHAHADDDATPAPIPNRTMTMKVINAIREHIVQGRSLGALQEWELACEDQDFAKGVWSGLTSPEQDEIRRLRGKAEKDPV